MSEELSKEQLVTYVKKAKAKIKKLSEENALLKEAALTSKAAFDAPGDTAQPRGEDEDLISSMWGGISSIGNIATGLVTEVTSVVKDEAEENTSDAISSSETNTEIAKLKKLMKEKIQEIDTLKEALVEKSQEVEVLMNQTMKAENKEMTALKKVVELEETILGLRNEVNSNLSGISGAVDRSKKDAVQAQERVIALEKELEQKSETLTRELDAHKRKEEVSEKSLEEATTKLCEQTHRAEKAEGEILVLCEQVVALENEGKGLQEVVKELHDRLERGNSEDKSRVDSEVEVLTTKVASLQKECDALKAAVDFNHNNESTISSKLSSTEQLQKKTLAKLKETKKENLSLKKDMSVLKGRFEELEKSPIEKEDSSCELIQKEKERVAAAEVALDKVRAELTKERDHAVANVKAQLVVAQEQVTSIHLELEAAQKAHTQELREKEKLLAETESGHMAFANSTKQMEEKYQNEASMLKAEKNSAQRKLEVSQTEADEARTERERMRRRVLELEEQIEQAALLSENASKESLDAWEQEKKQLEEANIQLAASVQTLESRLDETKVASQVQERELAGTKDMLESLLTSSSEMKFTLDQALKREEELKVNLTSKVQEIASGKDKTDALSNKISRLKTLLQRSKELAQEKELEVEKMAEKAVRVKRFQVLTLVEAPTIENDGQTEKWCHILDHGDNGNARWIEHKEIDEWLKNGSAMIGDMPESLQVQHARDIKAVRVNLEKDLDEASQELKDLSDSFASYKARAHTALKRVGNDERQAKAHEQELKLNELELSRLMGELERLETVLREKEVETISVKASLTALQQTLDNTKASASYSADQARIALEAKEKEVSSLQSSVATMEFRLNQMENERITSVATRSDKEDITSAVSTLRATSPATPMEAHTHETLLKVESTVSSNSTPSIVPPKSLEKGSYVITDKHPSSPRVSISPHDASARNHQELDVLLSAGEYSGVKKERKGTDAMPMYPFFSPQHHVTPSTTQSNSMLMRQANHELTAGIADLRQQNSTLYVEVQDLEHKLALNTEQTQSLKTVIRELEATLAREREFNSTAQQSVNMEYLTNILRKFLLSNAPSERAKLASVLCQILHFTSTEVHVIDEIWKERKGLAGWLAKRPLLVGEALAPDMER